MRSSWYVSGGPAPPHRWLRIGVLQLGHALTTGGYWNGPIASTLIFNEKLSAANAATVRGYLYAKYGVPT